MNLYTIQILLLAQGAMINVSMKTPRHYRGGFQICGQKALARQLRKNQTTAEELLWRLLRNRQVLGFKFRRQHQFGEYIADFTAAKQILLSNAMAPLTNRTNHGITIENATLI